MSLSSDLFSAELSTVGEVVWVDGEQLGVLFLEEARRNDSLSPAAWLERVLEHGRPRDGLAHPRDPERVVPAVRSASSAGSAIPIRGGGSRRRSG